MRKHRYESARSLADDLGRRLAGEPVSAARQVALATPTARRGRATSVLPCRLVTDRGFWVSASAADLRAPWANDGVGRRGTPCLELWPAHRDRDVPALRLRLPLRRRQNGKRVIHDRDRSIRNGLRPAGWVRRLRWPSRAGGRGRRLKEMCKRRYQNAWRPRPLAVPRATPRSKYAWDERWARSQRPLQRSQRRSGQRFLVEKKIDRRVWGLLRPTCASRAAWAAESKTLAAFATAGGAAEEALHKARPSPLDARLYEPKAAGRCYAIRFCQAEARSR